MEDYLVNFINIFQIGGKESINYKEEFKKDCPDYDFLPLILDQTSRTIAIGDIHGDLNLAIQFLKIAKCIKEVKKDEVDSVNTISVIFNDNNVKYYKWIGKDTQVVQVGDQIDRCRPYDNNKCDNVETTFEDEASDIKILKFYTDINKLAVKKGGKVISLIGNHELMNVAGNMKYVSYKGIIEFAKDTDSYEEGLNNRKKAFSNEIDYKDNNLNEFLACTRVSSVIIGEFLFVHAGIVNNENDKNDKNKLKDLNLIVRKWLLNKVKDESVNQIIKKDNNTTFNEEIDNIIKSTNSIFWTRFLGYLANDKDNINIQNLNEFKEKCDKYLNPLFETYNIKGIVIGHTPQTHQNGINSTCNERIWRVDIGASKAFNHFRKKKVNIEVLEITKDDKINKNIYKILKQIN